MVINWYGEGCFKVQTGGLTLLTDPLESSTGLTPARGKNEVVLQTLTPWPLKLLEQGEEFWVRGGGEYEIRGLNIRGFSVPEESSDKFLNTVYLVTIEEMRLVFLGHLSDALSPTIIGELQNPDLVFIPAGGKPFILQDKAAKLLKQLNPKIAVASFFKVSGLKRPSSDWKNLAEEIDQKPEVMEKLTIRKKEVHEQKGMKTVVLQI